VILARMYLKADMKDSEMANSGPRLEYPVTTSTIYFIHSSLRS